MKIILVGSGGREHALAWAISDSPLCDELIVTPGNPGTQAYGRRADIAAEDIKGLVHLAQTEQADIVVIGPEVPWVEGLADRLEAVGIRAFGPSAAAARLAWRLAAACSGASPASSARSSARCRA